LLGTFCDSEDGKICHFKCHNFKFTTVLYVSEGRTPLKVTAEPLLGAEAFPDQSWQQPSTDKNTDIKRQLIK
jgi:hypothetical protein